MASITLRNVKGSALTFQEGDDNFNNLNNDKIELADLSVGAEGTASGDGAIAYNNTTGVFTYTPPDLSSYLTDYTVTQGDVTQHQAALSITENQISDLQSYLTSETVTTLSLATNTLSYTDENGATTNIDLSLYLDDTNLARLTSGTLNASTGIATFTRDDASTFTVDFSALLNVTLADLSVSQNAASGNGTLSYNNTTGVFTYTPPDLSSYLTSYTETDPVVGAVSGIVKADGAGTISAAVANTDYVYSSNSGSTGQILTKTSGGAEWADASGGAGVEMAFFEVTSALGEEVSSSKVYRNEINKISDINSIVTSNTNYTIVLPAGTYVFSSGGLQSFSNVSNLGMYHYLWNETSNSSIFYSSQFSVPIGTNSAKAFLNWEKLATFASSTTISLRTERTLTYGNISAQSQTLRIVKIA